MPPALPGAKALLREKAARRVFGAVGALRQGKLQDRVLLRRQRVDGLRQVLRAQIELGRGSVSGREGGHGREVA